MAKKWTPDPALWPRRAEVKRTDMATQRRWKMKGHGLVVCELTSNYRRTKKGAKVVQFHVIQVSEGGGEGIISTHTTKKAAMQAAERNVK